MRSPFPTRDDRCLLVLDLDDDGAIQEIITVIREGRLSGAPKSLDDQGEAS